MCPKLFSKMVNPTKSSSAPHPSLSNGKNSGNGHSNRWFLLKRPYCVSAVDSSPLVYTSLIEIVFSLSVTSLQFLVQKFQLYPIIEYSGLQERNSYSISIELSIGIMSASRSKM